MHSDQDLSPEEEQKLHELEELLRQVDELKPSIRRSNMAEAEKLKKEIENFQKNASLMSDEVRQSKEQELAMRSQVTLPQRAQIMEQVFVGAINEANAKILTESRPILKEIVDNRGETVLLDRSAVMYAAPETNVTQEVLAALDKKLKSVEVKDVSLADVDKAIQELAAAQAQARNQ